MFLSFLSLGFYVHVEGALIDPDGSYYVKNMIYVIVLSILNAHNVFEFFLRH